MSDKIPERAVARMSVYRRFILRRMAEGESHVYSHELAHAAGVTAAQARRDIMLLGTEGSSARGYDMNELVGSIATFLDSAEPQSVALVGVGNLGRAILAFFSGRRQALRITVAFDKDLSKTGRVILGCRCYVLAQAQQVFSEMGIRAAIIAVPAVEAQNVADMLVGHGVRGILNFAPVRLRVPRGVFVEEVDLTTSLEKVAFFSRKEIKV